MPVKACFVTPAGEGAAVELVAFMETGSCGKEAIHVELVLTFLQQELGKLYVPRYIVHLPDGLPRTASGKPDQNILRRMAAEQVSGESGDTASTAHAEDAASAVVSVLGEATVEPGGGRSFNIDLRLPEWKPLKDHRYRGDAIFPGSGYVALAAEVCDASGWAGWELQDLVFSKALPLDDASPRPLKVTAVTTEAGVDITIASLPHGSDWVTHATCQGLKLDVPATSEPAAPSEAGEDYSVETLYSQMRDGGFDYGHQFQALTSVFRRSAKSAGGTVAHRESPFVLDFVDVDVCFHITPLVSALGFQGAPVRIAKIQSFARSPPGTTELQVSVMEQASSSSSAIDFMISSGDATLFTLQGLTLQPFDSLPAETLRVSYSQYEPSGKVAGQYEAVARVVAIGATASDAATALAQELGTSEVCIWSDGQAVEVIALSSVALVVQNDAEEAAGVAELLLTLQQELPWQGRVWLVVVGGGKEGCWQSLGRQWAVEYPALLLSVLSVTTVGSGCVAPMLDLEAPPCIENGRVWHLQLPTESANKLEGSQLCGKTVPKGASIVVLAAERSPLVDGVLLAVAAAGGTGALVLPGDKAPGAVQLAILCALGAGGNAAAGFESICAEADACVTLACMSCLLPSIHSRRAVPSAKAASLSRQRAQSGHASWVVYVPPLFAGLWFEPPAPAGFHRCSIEMLSEALAAITEPADCIVGLPATIPKHYSRITTIATTAARDAADVREFLLAELAETLKVDPSELGVNTGLDDLGVTSLFSLRLSQRLRRFVGREFSAFILSRNPTIADLVDALTSDAAVSVTETLRGRVLCLHGYRTSSTVLQQQMVPLTSVLEKLGYGPLIVPNGPFKSQGEAQFAEGLDQEDSYSWWEYEAAASVDGPTPGSEQEQSEEPLGLSKSMTYILEIVAKQSGPIVGVVGFSQGGAMAAQVANSVGAKWALLFSPIFVPGSGAQCDCPTLVAYDRADEVVGAPLAHILLAFSCAFGLTFCRSLSGGRRHNYAAGAAGATPRAQPCRGDGGAWGRPQAAC